jgi:hypothetical protein
MENSNLRSGLSTAGASLRCSCGLPNERVLDGPRGGIYSNLTLQTLKKELEVRRMHRVQVLSLCVPVSPASVAEEFQISICNCFH